MISAVLFGALAGTGVLPFSRAQFEATIERGGVGVKPSLRAFGAAFARAQANEVEQPVGEAAEVRRPSAATRSHATRPCARSRRTRSQLDFPLDGAARRCSKACAA